MMHSTTVAPSLTKDDVELELEKLVFGDAETFRSELHTFDDDANGDQRLPLGEPGLQIKQKALGKQQDLAALEDSEVCLFHIEESNLNRWQLFFFDSGQRPNAQPTPAVVNLKGVSAEQTANELEPAWVDSDDERVTVSLATSNRLRKLRHAEGEDIVTGVEYTRRLRQQYERLHPPPEWATYLRSRTKENDHRKRRRLSASSSDTDEMEIDEDGQHGYTSTQPLAQLLRSTSPLVKSSARKSNGSIVFRTETLDIQRTKDVSSSQPDAVTSLSFHPSLPLLLSSGPLGSEGQVTLHHIAPAAPVPNPQLTRIPLRHLPTYTSAFHASGTKVILTARRRYYHVWDLESGHFQLVASLSQQDDQQATFDQFALSPCGRYIAFVGSGRKGEGFVNVVDVETGQWVCSGQVEGHGGVADLAWWQSGDGLAILGKGGEVLEYSVRERRPLARWTDEGSVGATKIALGGLRTGNKRSSGLGGDRYVAIGSSAGIVNIYDRSPWTDRAGAVTVPEQPSPKRTFDQLVTSISTLRFSPDGQLLAMASQDKRDALRIVHTPSCTVYRNWPTSDTPLGRISSLAWGMINAEGELVLAIANDRGRIRLWLVRG